MSKFGNNFFPSRSVFAWKWDRKSEACANLRVLTEHSRRPSGFSIRGEGKIRGSDRTSCLRRRGKWTRSAIKNLLVAAATIKLRNSSARKCARSDAFVLTTADWICKFEWKEADLVRRGEIFDLLCWSFCESGWANIDREKICKYYNKRMIKYTFHFKTTNGLLNTSVHYGINISIETNEFLETRVFIILKRNIVHYFFKLN